MQVQIKISTLDQLRDVTDLLQEHLSRWPISSEKQMNIRLCLMEAVQNGLLYGVPENGAPVEVKICWTGNPQGFVFSVEDNGPGIPVELRTPESDILSLEEHGRGLMLMHAILDELTFNEKGNQLTGRMRW